MTPIPYLRALGYFATVAEQGSISAAASVLKLSPSVISRSMSALEEQLEVKLFYRTRGNFRLTPEGVALLHPAANMLASARQAMEAIEMSRNEPAGTLRITVPTEFGYGWLPNRLAQYTQQNPKVNLELVYDDAVVDILNDGFDLALRFRQPKDVRVYQRKLTSFNIVAVASPSLITKRDADQVDKVCTLPVIGRIRGADPSRIIGHHRKTGDSFSFTPETQIAMDGTLPALHAIEEGLGCALFLEPCVEDAVSEGRLLRVLKSYDFGAVDLYALFAASPPPLAVRRMIDLLAS